MPAPTTLHLSQPCHEAWDAMRPTGPGRHCTTCQQVVVDFTAMTDGEVVAFQHQRPDVSCGWFRASQLDRPLLAASQPVVGWRRWLGGAAALLGLGALAAPSAHAQSLRYSGSAGPIPAADPVPLPPAVATATPTPPAPPVPVASAAAEAAAPPALVVRGRVYSWLGLPVGHGRISLYGPGHDFLASTQANRWGYFELAVPAGRPTESLSLWARHRASIGRYSHTLSRRVEDIDPSQPCRVVLERHKLLRGGKFR